jgi:hypothetical protein
MTGWLKLTDRQSRHLYDLVRMMGTAVEEQALIDQELYKVLLEHRSSYIRLKGVDYGTLKSFSLSFVPPDDMMELFRQDYIQMQRGMIYGESLEFETLVDHLRLLNGRFRVIGEGRALEEIIAKATLELNNLSVTDKDEVMARTFAEYKGDVYKAASPSNRSVRYTVYFLQRGNDWIFHSIEIDKPFLSQAQ